MFRKFRCFKFKSASSMFCRNCSDVILEGKTLKEHMHYIQLQINYHERLKSKIKDQEKRVDKMLFDLREQLEKLQKEADEQKQPKVK